MFVVNVWLITSVLTLVSCLPNYDLNVCRWHAGEIGRCVPLEECVQSTLGPETVPLQKCRQQHWEGVCCKSTQNKAEIFVFDSTKSIYKIYPEDVIKIAEMQHISSHLTKKQVINRNDGIIFHNTDDNDQNETANLRETTNNHKIIYNNADSEDILIANLQNQSQFHRKSRQLNLREDYERTFGYNDDRVTFSDENFNRQNENRNRQTNSYRESNSQRNKEYERRRTDNIANNRYTTERQLFTRRSPNYQPKLRPIDDSPDEDINFDYDYEVRSTTRRSVTSRTEVSNRNRVNREEEDSFVFDDGVVRREGSIGRIPVSGRVGNAPEVVMGPDENGMTEDEKENSYNTIKKMCEKYSRSVTKQITATPLLLLPETVTMSISRCHLDSNPLIVGGELARHNQFPHMAAVGWPAVRGDRYEWLCGGSLVSEKFVLTAAHCTYQDRDDTVLSGPPRLVHLGSNSLDDNKAQRIRIQRLYRHPRYRVTLSYNDIALLKLTVDAELSDSVRPACLGFAPQTGENVVAAGWGLTSFSGAATRELRTVALKVWDEVGCRQAYQSSRRLPHGIDQSQLCAGHPQGGKDTCQGDSGGPLQVQSQENQCIAYIVGVTSLGRACGHEQSPAVYTRVSQHVHFITQVVWPNL